MNIRELAEEKEYRNLSPYAVHSRESKGRERQEAECDVRTVFRGTGTGLFIRRRFGG